MNDKISESYRAYVESMDHDLRKLYRVSDQARAKGHDPSLKTECIIAQDIADLVEGLVGPKGVAVSIRELSVRLQREEIAFKIAEEIKIQLGIYQRDVTSNIRQT